MVVFDTVLASGGGGGGGEHHNNQTTVSAMTRALFRRVFLCLLLPCVLLTQRTWQNALQVAYSSSSSSSFVSTTTTAPLLPSFAAMQQQQQQNSPPSKNDVPSLKDNNNNNKPLLMIYIQIPSFSLVNTVAVDDKKKKNHAGSSSSDKDKIAFVTIHPTCATEFWSHQRPAAATNDAATLPNNLHCWQQMQHTLDLHHARFVKQQQQQNGKTTTTAPSSPGAVVLYQEINLETLLSRDHEYAALLSYYQALLSWATNRSSSSSSSNLATQWRVVVALPHERFHEYWIRRRIQVWQTITTTTTTTTSIEDKDSAAWKTLEQDDGTTVVFTKRDDQTRHSTKRLSGNNPLLRTTPLLPTMIEKRQLATTTKQQQLQQQQQQQDWWKNATEEWSRSSQWYASLRQHAQKENLLVQLVTAWQNVTCLARALVREGQQQQQSTTSVHDRDCLSTNKIGTREIAAAAWEDELHQAWYQQLAMAAWREGIALGVTSRVHLLWLSVDCRRHHHHHQQQQQQQHGAVFPLKCPNRLALQSLLEYSWQHEVEVWGQQQEGEEEHALHWLQFVQDFEHLVVDRHLLCRADTATMLAHASWRDFFAQWRPHASRM